MNNSWYATRAAVRAAVLAIYVIVMTACVGASDDDSVELTDQSTDQTTDQSSDQSIDPSDDARAASPLSLRVMSFNIEWGGTHVRFASITEAIRAADADIVGVQEAEGNLPRLARDLGWYYNPRNYVVSKYPIVDPPDGDGEYVFIEVLPGQVVALANVHLPSSPYGITWLRNGRTPADVIALERRVRLPKIEPVLRTLPALFRDGTPVFLTGDFNSPSHADWTREAIGKFPRRDIALEWPVSRAIADAGMQDSFRTVFPDPVKKPGFTWWAARPRIENYNPADKTRQNRIDFLWYAGPARVTNSQVVGEAGAPVVAIPVTPWPSDHRAVVSEFEATPAPMPVLVATNKRVYESGETIQVLHRCPSQVVSPPGSIELQQIVDAEHSVAQRRVDIDTVLGRMELPGDNLPPGWYRIVLLDDAGATISQNEFWILDPNDAPSVGIDGISFADGDALPISWSNAPGNRNDWVGIFDAASASDSRNYVTYGYVGARSSGTMLLDAGTAESTWPLPSGEYVARLLLDDGFEVLAESEPFTVE